MIVLATIAIKRAAHGRLQAGANKTSEILRAGYAGILLAGSAVQEKRG